MKATKPQAPSLDELVRTTLVRLDDGTVTSEALGDLAETAYRIGVQEQLGKLVTAPEVARRLGVTRAWVRHLAIENDIGAVAGSIWVFREEDVAALRRILRESVPGRRKSFYRRGSGPWRPREVAQGD